MSDSILQVNQIKDKGGNATGITVADTTANVTIGNLTATTAAINAGTIGDNVNLSNKYYLQLKLTNNFAFPSAGRYIATTGTTDPYFTMTGDTTNLAPDTTNNIKVLRKGIYLINFSGTFLFGSTSVARAVVVYIRGGTSVDPTTVLAASVDQISSTVSGNDHGSASCSFIGELPANYYLRFFAESVQAGEAELTDVTHANIVLIRPTA